MRKITVEFPDEHDDLVSITAIGQSGMRVSVMVQAVQLRGHDGEMLVLHPEDEHEWRKPETNWIPVSERLPEIGKPVLTFDGKCFTVERYIDRFYCDGEEIEGEWWIDGYEGDECDPIGLRDSTAIAWMPLPEPPEEV